MTRRQIREEIFKLLFGVEFHEDDERETQLSNYLNEPLEDAEILLEEGEKLPEFSEEDKAYIEEKYRLILSRLDEIDATLNEKVSGWKTGRMAKVDLAILRLAVYEIRFDEEIPEGVAINEAVELAKKYGTDKSGSFVNGALAKVVA